MSRTWLRKRSTNRAASGRVMRREGRSFAVNHPQGKSCPRQAQGPSPCRCLEPAPVTTTVPFQASTFTLVLPVSRCHSGVWLKTMNRKNSVSASDSGLVMNSVKNVATSPRAEIIARR